MTRDEIKQLVVGAIQTHLTPSCDVTESSKLVEDLGADSLDQVELVMQFEETFGIEIPDEDLSQLTTVEGIIDYIQNRTGKTEA